MNAIQEIAQIESAGLPLLTNARNERGLQRAEKARSDLIEKLRRNFLDQVRINPGNDALKMHVHLFEKAYSCTDANLWQTGEEYVMSQTCNEE